MKIQRKRRNSKERKKKGALLTIRERKKKKRKEKGRKQLEEDPRLQKTISSKIIELIFDILPIIVNTVRRVRVRV